MKQSPKPEAAALKALTEVLAARLADFVQLGDVQDTLRVATGEVLLPESSLFTSGPKGTGPTARARYTLEDLVMAYEAFVEQSLGATRCPGAVIEKVLNAAVPRSATGDYATSDWAADWFTPAARLIATIANAPGLDAVLELDLDNFDLKVCVDGLTFHVTPDRVFSNTLGRMVDVVRPPSDKGQALCRSRGRVTSDPVLVTLARAYGDDSGVLACLSAFAELQASGQASTQEVAELVSSGAMSRRTRCHAVQSTMREAAAQQAIDVLYRGDDVEVIPRLYKVLVPNLFTSDEFVRTFGSISHRNRHRKPRAGTRDRWRDLIILRT